MSNAAAWVKEARSEVKVQPADIWSPGAGELLVKNESISINPIEARIQKLDILPTTYPAILGFSFAGTVVKVGSDVSNVKPGDTVAVARWGKIVGDTRFGAFQKYPLALEANTTKIDPAKLDDASAVLINLATVVSVLNIHMGLDRPPISGKAVATGKTLLVYGGSSNLGGLAIKYASDAGYKIVTTSSPANKHLVMMRGPTYVVDHTGTPENVVAELKAYGPYDAVLDPIGTPAATVVINRVLAETGGVYYTTLPLGKGDKLSENVDKRFELYGLSLNAPANRHIKEWFLKEYLPQGLGNGNIFPHPILKMKGGLGSIQEALDKLSSNSVSGVKIVINPQEKGVVE